MSECFPRSSDRVSPSIFLGKSLPLQLQKSSFSLQNQCTSEDGQEVQISLDIPSDLAWDSCFATAWTNTIKAQGPHTCPVVCCCTWHVPPLQKPCKTSRPTALQSHLGVQFRKLLLRGYRATSKNADHETHTSTNPFFLEQWCSLLGSRMTAEKSISWYAESLQTKLILNTKQYIFTAVDSKTKKAQVAGNQFPTPMPAVCTK